MSDTMYDAPKAPVGMAAGVPLAYTPTPLHRKVLKNYREVHGKPLRFGSLLRYSWPRLVGILLIFGGGALVLKSINQQEMLWFYLGLGTAALLSEVGKSRVFLKVWPMMEAIVDWDKVDAILGKAPDDPQYPRSAN